MSARTPLPLGRMGGPRPVVGGRRHRDLLRDLLGGLIPLIVGLAITIAVPHPNPLLIFGLILGAAGIVVLLVSRRYEISVAILAIYLGMLDGPVKLESASKASSGVRDVLILAVVLGMLMRLVTSKQRVLLPPLSAWVIAFGAFVLAEAFNPHTLSILKSIGGWRQQLEWVPFFFFGYTVIRSKERFRRLFMLLGVIALANGLVGTVQAKISPASLASWGPGYAGIVHGGEEGSGITGRTYKSGGVTHARPPALGSDSGFGGGIGVIALPGLLALLAADRSRRRWPAVICALGALLGIATAASRTSIVSAVVVLLTFGLLSVFSGIKIGRAFVVLVAVLTLSLGVGAALIAANGSGIFARQESLTSVSSVQEHGASAKERNLAEIPTDLVHAPFGFGLGVAGSASGFGGHSKLEFEGERVTGGSAYSLLMKELGAPGLLLWIGFTLNVILLAGMRMRRVRDQELRIYLLGALVAFLALTVQGFSGPTLAVTTGAFLWFVPGVISYWFAGEGSVEALAPAEQDGAGRRPRTPTAVPA